MTTEGSRKRRNSDGSSKTKTWSISLVILSVVLILSISNITEESNITQEQAKRRRYLLSNFDETLIDGSGPEENIWRRNLRAKRRRTKKNAERKLLQQDDTPTLMTDSPEGEANPMKRMAVIDRYADRYHFDDCVGETIADCEAIINAKVMIAQITESGEFNNQTSLTMDIRKIRELTDYSYHKVVIRTNLDGDQADGIFEDGMIYYPWPWMVNGVAQDIGPWSCQETGVHDSPAACCTKIQEDIDYPDDNGNYIACYVEEPVGGPNNPIIDGRVIVVVGADQKVVRSPINH